MNYAISVNFTCNRGNILQSFHGWTWTFCVWVWNVTILTMDYPIPLPKSIIGHHVFLYACLCDLLPNGGSLTIVDVHGWYVSTVIQHFFWFCPWLKVLTNAHTSVCTASMCLHRYNHTHTHTHTHTHAHTQRPAHIPVLRLLFVQIARFFFYVLA